MNKAAQSPGAHPFYIVSHPRPVPVIVQLPIGVVPPLVSHQGVTERPLAIPIMLVRAGREQPGPVKVAPGIIRLVS